MSKQAEKITDPRGFKRICTSCGTRFYDMNKRPIVCPSCETEFTNEFKVKSRRGRLAVNEDSEGQVSKKTVKDTENDEDEIEDEDDDAEIVSLDDLENSDDDEGDDLGGDVDLDDDDDLDDLDVDDDLGDLDDLEPDAELDEDEGEEEDKD